MRQNVDFIFETFLKNITCNLVANYGVAEKGEIFCDIFCPEKLSTETYLGATLFWVELKLTEPIGNFSLKLSGAAGSSGSLELDKVAARGAAKGAAKGATKGAVFLADIK